MSTFRNICKSKILAVLPLILLSGVFIRAQSNSWKTLTPLISTRAEVEQILGPPEKECDYQCEYRFEKWHISAIYTIGECEDGWSVGKNVLLELSVPPGAEDTKMFNDRKLDKRNLSFTSNDAFYGSWTDAQAGIQFSTSPYQELTGIRYIPKRSDNNLRCDGFPKFTPEGHHYPGWQFDLASNKYDEQDILERIYSRLGTFLGQTVESRNTHKGYILVYFDNKLSLKRYRSLVGKFEKYIFKDWKIQKGEIAIIEGGLRNIAEIELYILPNEWEPPAPNPTFPSPQFMRAKKKR
ncbi:MAG: hypothetical protein KDB79_06330 [Acidobacteria bacterium]|nr:hypothetical protein [Acidobacteriota bacterium]